MIKDLSVQQLRRAITIKEQIETLTAELAAIAGDQAPAKPGRKKGGMSAAGRARIVAAQRARWAKVHAAKAAVTDQPKKAKRTMSAAGRAAISAAAKARWAKLRRQR